MPPSSGTQCSAYAGQKLSRGEGCGPSEGPRLGALAPAPPLPHYCRVNQALRDLEELVVDAWPASETHELDGWLLRSSGGPSRRGNSVATLAFGRERDVATAIGEVEAWYAARGAPARFQLGPCARPKQLAEVLLARGYQAEGAAIFALAPAFPLSARRPTDAFSVRITPQPDAGWHELLQAGRFAGEPDPLRGVLRDLGTRCRFATAYEGQERAVAAALGIASEDRLGVYNMLTAPAARRRGAAQSLLHALAQSAIADGMRELYLLVEQDNQPARTLYASAGFRDVYPYGYLTQPKQT